MVGKTDGEAKYQREWRRTTCVYLRTGASLERSERYSEGEARIQVMR